MRGGERHPQFLEGIRAANGNPFRANVLKGFYMKQILFVLAAPFPRLSFGFFYLAILSARPARSGDNRFHCVDYRNGKIQVKIQYTELL